MLKRLLGISPWYSRHLKPADFRPPRPLLPWGFVAPPADASAPANQHAEELLQRFKTSKATFQQGAAMAYRSVAGELGKYAFGKDFAGVTPPLAALLNDWLASHLLAGCWPALELNGETRVTIVKADVCLGSADRYNKVMGLFSPQEVRHHLLEGALGPEYRYNAEDTGSSPRRVCVDAVIESGVELRCQPLSAPVRALAVELGLDPNKLPQDVTVPPPPPPPYPRQLWSFEADVVGPDSLGPWQLFNINQVLKVQQ